MISTVYVLGQLARAIYEEGGNYFIVGAGWTKDPIECRSGDISFYLDCASEVSKIVHDDITRAEIEDILARETLFHRTLKLTLSGLDEEISPKGRSLSIEAAQQLLDSNTSLVNFLRNRLLARQLPAKADIEGGVHLAEALGAANLALFYSELAKTQPSIRWLSEAWNEVSLKLGFVDHERGETEKELIRAGVFARLVTATASGDLKELDAEVAAYSSSPEASPHPATIHVLNAVRDRLAVSPAFLIRNRVYNEENEETTSGQTRMFPAGEVGRKTKQIKELIEFGGRDLSVQTGKIAKQADGSVVIRYGDTMVFCAAVRAGTPREGIDFFPLTVEYRESNYAAGRIPGNYFRREERPNEKEVLTSRLIDRPCRPLFAEGYRDETQVIAQVISADPDNNPDVVAITGASCALYLSDIPFLAPIAGVRIGLIEGRYIVNPTYDEVHDSRLNLIVAGTEEAIVMVEAGALEVSEELMLEALMLAHKEINRLCRWQKELYKALDIQKREVTRPVINEEMLGEIERNHGERLRAALDTTQQDKLECYAVIDALKKEVVEGYPEDRVELRQMAKAAFDHLKETIFRDDILKKRRRPDGRRFLGIRPITSEVGWLPRVHGSALFTRGETQAIVTTTLGTKEDEQFLDDLEKGEVKRRFMLNYNFPHFSVGEVGRFGSPGRREIGHGALARRALEAVLPDESAFPYTIRIVSDITESNGSSSMATVCGGTLSLMDAGVPLKAPVAGVAVGLVMEENKYAILTDIAGAEDHYADMDLKVAGTRQGITALQMDIKIAGIDAQIMAEALEQARKGRLYVLSAMEKALPESRTEISQHAPRIIEIKINPDKIRDVIGPGGKMIRSIVEETGAKIDVSDDGTIFIATSSSEAAAAAVNRIRGLTAEAEVGQTYLGTVTRIVDFGAFVEIFPGTDGLLHISEIADRRVKDVRDELREGQQIFVKCIGKEGNKIKLSQRAVLKNQKQRAEAAGEAGE